MTDKDKKDNVKSDSEQVEKQVDAKEKEMQDKRVEKKDVKGKAKTKKEPIMKKFPNKRKTNLKLAGLSALVVLLGIGTGWMLSGGTAASNTDTGPNGEKVAPGAETTNGEAGVEDESIFSDTAEGILEKGGVEGEGTHHLVREGGPTKYVYLTSTIIDLESYTGKTVQVWGETIAAQQAPWLMDVGKIKVIE